MTDKKRTEKVIIGDQQTAQVRQQKQQKQQVKQKPTQTPKKEK